MSARCTALSEGKKGVQCSGACPARREQCHGCCLGAQTCPRLVGSVLCRGQGSLAQAGCRQMPVTRCPSPWGKGGRGPGEERLPALLSPGGNHSLQGHFKETQGSCMACSWSRSTVIPPYLLWPPWVTLFSFPPHGLHPPRSGWSDSGAQQHHSVGWKVLLEVSHPSPLGAGLLQSQTGLCPSESQKTSKEVAQHCLW